MKATRQNIYSPPHEHKDLSVLVFSGKQIKYKTSPSSHWKRSEYLKKCHSNIFHFSKREKNWNISNILNTICCIAHIYTHKYLHLFCLRSFRTIKIYNTIQTIRWDKAIDKWGLYEHSENFLYDSWTFDLISFLLHKRRRMRSLYILYKTLNTIALVGIPNKLFLN